MIIVGWGNMCFRSCKLPQKLVAQETYAMLLTQGCDLFACVSVGNLR